MSSAAEPRAIAAATASGSCANVSPTCLKVRLCSLTSCVRAVIADHRAYRSQRPSTGASGSPFSIAVSKSAAKPGGGCSPARALSNHVSNPRRLISRISCTELSEPSEFMPIRIYFSFNTASQGSGPTNFLSLEPLPNTVSNGASGSMEIRKCRKRWRRSRRNS